MSRGRRRHPPRSREVLATSAGLSGAAAVSARAACASASKAQPQRAAKTHAIPYVIPYLPPRDVPRFMSDPPHLKSSGTQPIESIQRSVEHERRNMAAVRRVFRRRPDEGDLRHAGSGSAARARHPARYEVPRQPRRHRRARHGLRVTAAQPPACHDSLYTVHEQHPMLPLTTRALPPAVRRAGHAHRATRLPPWTKRRRDRCRIPGRGTAPFRLLTSDAALRYGCRPAARALPAGRGTSASADRDRVCGRRNPASASEAAR